MVRKTKILKRKLSLLVRKKTSVKTSNSKKGKSTSKRQVKLKKKLRKNAKKIKKVSAKAKSKKKIKKQVKKGTKTKTKVIVRKSSIRKRVRKAPFLKNPEYYEFITNIVGKEGLKVVNRLAEKEVSDVELTEKIKLKPNIVRKHLYALYEAGIVTYRRHRSKTGWYTYYWKIHPEKIDSILSEKRLNELRKFQELLGYEKENHFYECKKKCTRAVFSEAAELQFKCPKCGGLLEYIDNSNRVMELEKRIEELSRKLNFGNNL